MNFTVTFPILLFLIIIELQVSAMLKVLRRIDKNIASIYDRGDTLGSEQK